LRVEGTTRDVVCGNREGLGLPVRAVERQVGDATGAVTDKERVESR
jgi:hypothetical protein